MAGIAFRTAGCAKTSVTLGNPSPETTGNMLEEADELAEPEVAGVCDSAMVVLSTCEGSATKSVPGSAAAAIFVLSQKIY